MTYPHWLERLSRTSCLALHIIRAQQGNLVSTKMIPSSGPLLLSNWGDKTKRKNKVVMFQVNFTGLRNRPVTITCQSGLYSTSREKRSKVIRGLEADLRNLDRDPSYGKTVIERYSLTPSHLEGLLNLH